MAAYEILVHKASRRPVTARPQGFPWKPRELDTSVFGIVAMDLTDLGVAELLNGDYIYAPASSTLFGLADGSDEFDPNIVLDKTDAPPHEAVIRAVATELDPNWETTEPNVCKFLHPDWMPWSPEDGFRQARRYWFRKFRNFKALPGIRRFMAAIRYRDYGVIANAGRDLPRATKQALFSSNVFSAQDKAWMAWTWRYTPE
jgi:hypothetical protein